MAGRQALPLQNLPYRIGAIGRQVEGAVFAARQLKAERPQTPAGGLVISLRNGLRLLACR